MRGDGGIVGACARCCLLVLWALVPGGAGAQMTLAEIAQGTLVGAAAVPDASVVAFKGIPYAAPPVGALRWQPPRAPAGWAGRRMAAEFAPDCMQPPYPDGSFYARLFPIRATSEDCLYLNVWTPAARGAKLPVMVWIHGGALTRGSGAQDYYDGAHLAAKGVVVVTINYRLGVFGYFAHPELIEESPQRSAGNYGVLDQIRALEWVRDNIEAFGGDAGNVTVFGQSAGAWSISYLHTSPLARGLFHRLIAQSGGRLDVRPSLEAAAAAGRRLAEAAQADSLAALRDMPAAALLGAATAAGFQTEDIVDGWVMPAQPYEILADGRQNRMPVLLGFNANEATTLVAPAFVAQTEEAYLAQIEALYGDMAARFLGVYPSTRLRASTHEAFRDYWFGWPAVTWARMTRQLGEQAFLYWFAHAPPGPESSTLGAYHAAEIPYVFGNAAALRDPATATDVALANCMSDYWVAFARSGMPRAAGRAAWPTFEAATLEHLAFDDGCASAGQLLPERWRLWDDIMAQLRR